MANYVKCVLEVKNCNRERFEQICEFVKTEESLFDLNRIIPMPKKLDILDKCWFCWKRNYWGTTRIIDAEKLDRACGWKFTTPWDAPRKPISILSRIFPEVTFELCYADMDIIDDYGFVAFRNGEIEDVDIC